jgi:GMP synthase-like glutamine amidotransferase
MTLLVMQHVPFEGPGAISDWAYSNGHRVEFCRLWAGDRLPDPDTIDGVAVMGGPMSIWETYRHTWLEPERHLISELVRKQVPVLGVCLGAQQIAAALGASVYRGPQKEIGFFPVTLANNAWRTLMSGRTPPPVGATVFHWHGDTFDLPEGAELLASSPVTPNQAFCVGTSTIALQFHLESTLESIDSLAAASLGEIGRGTYQVPADTARARLRKEQLCFGGACRSLLYALLDRLFGWSAADTAVSDS